MEARSITDLASDFVRREIARDDPWAECGKFPRKLDGTPYQGINIPALYAQGIGREAHAHDLIFGGKRQLSEAGRPVCENETAFGTIFAGFANKETSETDEEEINRIERSFKPVIIYRTVSHTGQEIHPRYCESERESVLQKRESLEEVVNTHLTEWQKAHPNKEMYADERSFILRITQDLWVGYRTGNLAMAGQWGGSYPAEARAFAERIKSVSPKMMRPWGIAMQILRTVEPALTGKPVATTAMPVLTPSLNW